MSGKSLAIFKKFGEAVTRIQQGTEERRVVERVPGSKHFTVVGKKTEERPLSLSRKAVR